MMFFRKYFDQRAIRKMCMNKIEQEFDNVRVVLLSRPMTLVDRYNDSRDYVARMGLFTEDMMDINIPHITWYCRRDGQIWPEWCYMLPHRGEEYDRYGHLLDSDRTRLVRVPMHYQDSSRVREIAAERWTMAKLDGSLDEIDQVRYAVTYPGGIDVII
jgi:hypothetical protein